ncbi:uncharacterized protein M421DRAFT_426448 [Didymella exigua CBS 183.55]|uniref:Uncharacterized protein n=1 Tax=Didymella exigua CBS 183.55 TaxID=1150837 RepID=A0A6A5R594_9PLEO|nr:uncharacterized protein M421DRAFT_426448 [Didymella exigua CBS 183.55]KAF1922823.1 hypothetical protein M421DRAFT_426448 [Didymella exigua CBS 183.55]
MPSTNEYGQGKSHATSDSAVPGKMQEQAPSGLEEALPDSISSTSTSKKVNSKT